MQAYDIFTLGLLIAATVWGARRGLARQLATLASLILGYAVALNFRQVFAELIDVAPPWNVLAAMLALFMATSFAVWVAFQFVSVSLRRMGLETFDTQMGALFGLAKGGLLAVIVTMFAVVMSGDQQRATVLNSLSGYNLCRLLVHTKRVVPSEWQQIIQPYFETSGQAGPLATEDDGQRHDEHSPSDLGSPLLPGPRAYEDPSFGTETGSLSQVEPRSLRANRSDVPQGERIEVSTRGQMGSAETSGASLSR